ncbi:sigma-70 family RNA polymerase sigma factor [Thermovibrio ammonificans]|jgi:RNA polymerase primary sigma factor|uniref:RNA polymerase, sigma 70 subunit, RpoD subfamily n=1 Tax=Thermovibrio ammonificans (strain DSM 15698 / JCM 12110 / HB-1) TaxID=648996 RepID=E8T2F6_THEA1|nr:RNA polymerase sigma factor RpoD/SigA [Thermovibrio ammonificans]ADU97051.1 RNA polymerase, sigma 70 subunit, RpoD subfamily [Thermovibrio ammonificans HB-1]
MEEKEFFLEDEENLGLEGIEEGESAELSLFNQEIDPSLIESFVPDKDSLDAFLKSISKIPLLSREEEIELAKRAKAGDKEALKKLVESNLRFVVSVAKKYLGCGLPLHDLIAEGILGLIEAARRFDPDKGVKFISYAVWWIRQSIMQALAQQTGAVKIPVKQAVLVNKITRSYGELLKKLGREPTIEELADYVGMEPKEVERLLSICQVPLSLDTPIGDEEDTTFKDFLKGEGTAEVEEKVVQEELKQSIQEMLEQLTPQEKKIIIMRFGLDGNEPKTLREIGEKLGISRERVRQLETRAKKKMKEYALRKKLNVFLN